MLHFSRFPETIPTTRGLRQPVACRDRNAGLRQHIVRNIPLVSRTLFFEGAMAGTATHKAGTAEPNRRDYIVIAAGAFGAVGAAAAAWPFIDQMNPSADGLEIGRASCRARVGQYV